MIIDSMNNMVGAAPHVREVGPHLHLWVDVGRDSAGYLYRECGVCGARSTTSPIAAQAEKRAWLCGGTWDAPPTAAADEPEVKPAQREDAERALAAAPKTLEEQAAAEAASAQVVAESEAEDSDEDDDRPDAPVRRRGRPRKVQP